MTSVKVAVRVRPFNDREKAQNSTSVINMDGKKLTTIKNPVRLQIAFSSFLFRKPERSKNLRSITATGRTMVTSRKPTKANT
jgi:hypothetical protein